MSLKTFAFVGLATAFSTLDLSRAVAEGIAARSDADLEGSWRRQHHKHRSVEEMDNNEAVRVEVKAVVRDRGFEGMKNVHRGNREHKERGDYGAAEACPFWCKDIGAAAKYVQACQNCGAAEEELDAYMEGESMEDESMESEFSKRHHKHRSVEEMDNKEAVRVEVKAVVRNKDFEGMKNVGRGSRYHKGFEAGEAPTPEIMLGAAEACAAYCVNTPRLTQQYDPNCAACPGAGTPPAGNPCEARCGYSPSTAWRYDPGCSGCQ